MLNHHQPLLDALRTDTLLITPNNRLSNYLLTCYLQEQSQRAVTKPACIPFATFLQRLYQQVRHQFPKQNHPRLLSDYATRMLWQQVISPESPDTCNTGLLDAVINAWDSCEAWRLAISHPQFCSKRETLQFQEWHAAFLNALQQQHAITPPQLIGYLLEYQFIPALPSLIWVCFGEYTPQQLALQQTLQKAGVKQQHYDFSHSPPPARCISADSTCEEYEQCIQWVKNKLADGAQRIGVVVPDLSAHAQTIQRLFKRHFAPKQLNFSCGQPLADYPLVAHALQWLQLDLSQISAQQIRLVLNSPYLAQAKCEAMARQQLLQDCAVLHGSKLDFTRFLDYLKPSCPELHLTLGQLTSLPALAPTNTWVNHFKQRFISLGFPGDESLNSASYQCLQRLHHLLEEFNSLHLLVPEMTRTRALNTLHQLAESTVFQPQLATEASIHVLGLLEASGCCFDGVWVMHLTDQCLPQKTHLSAFIPLTLQRELDMPHANPAREYQYAQQHLMRLQQGALETLVSYAQNDHDTPYLPSPLIQHLEPTGIILPEDSSLPQVIVQTEHYRHPVTHQEIITGGTQLLSNQAKCPFRAFAAHRLHAKALPQTTEGLTAQERGQLLHKSLELLWQNLQNQANLLEHDSATLTAIIQSAIQRALHATNYSQYLSFPPLLQQLETQRLNRLIQANLAQEKTRSPFQVVALEQAAQIELGGLRFNVKLDRLDQLENGKQWVIDYKSRAPERKPWDEERPEEPQLLLYALVDHRICGVLFIELRQGQVTYLGLSDEQSTIPGVKMSENPWTEQQTLWRKLLEALALEFQEGHCTPSPTRPITCTRCEFHSLCRVE